MLTEEKQAGTHVGAASGLAVIFIIPMMIFGALLAVFNDTTRLIAKFTPNYYVSDSLSIIFQQGRVSDPVILQNLLILAGISLVVVVAGIQLFKRNEFRKENPEIKAARCRLTNIICSLIKK